MKLQDLDFRVWDSDSESLLYANKEHLFLGYSQRECGEVIQEYGELEMHAYLNDEPLCPNACEIELCVGVDRKGKKIYEGDIVIFCDIKDELWVVELKVKGHLEAIIKPLNHNERKNILLPKYCEVIGNIHENPELLGGEK